VCIGLFLLHNNQERLGVFAGTRFRPLSLNVPKPLFPVAGIPMIQHHIEACAQVFLVLLKIFFLLVVF